MLSVYCEFCKILQGQVLCRRPPNMKNAQRLTNGRLPPDTCQQFVPSCKQTGKQSMFWKFCGRGVHVNISNLKSNIKNYSENEIKTIFCK